MIVIALFITRPPITEGHGEWAEAAADSDPA